LSRRALTAGLDGKASPAKRWITIGAAAAAVVLAVAGLWWFAASPRLIKGEKLAALLLDNSQISSVMGAQMTAGDVSTEAMTNPGGLSKAGCLGALVAAQELTYTDSGYTGLRWNEARDSAENMEHYFVQSVASFPDAGRAEAFVANSAALWRLCADQEVVTVKAEQPPMTWRLAGVVGVPPTISIAESRQDVRWTCQRALRAEANVVVDVTACAQQITDQGRRLGDQIAARVAK